MNRRKLSSFFEGTCSVWPHLGWKQLKPPHPRSPPSSADDHINTSSEALPIMPYKLDISYSFYRAVEPGAVTVHLCLPETWVSLTSISSREVFISPSEGCFTASCVWDPSIFIPSPDPTSQGRLQLPILLLEN